MATKKEVKKEENVFVIKDDVLATVLAENEERLLNPGMIADEDTGIVFIEGEPNKIIKDKYVPLKEADLILQEKKVVREWLKLQELKK